MKTPNWPTLSSKNEIKFGIERMKTLLEKLGNPERNMPPVFHVAGTNGKGSTTAYLKHIFEAQGYKVHRNTSPHLVEFNERIEVCGKPITDEYYYELAKECRQVVEKHNLDSSAFEIITAIAFMAFARNDADVTILEVGLGGRLDATNVVDNPLASIITPISFDHMEQLGDKLELIAMENMGIAKKNCPVLIAKQEKIVSKVLNERAKELSCPVFKDGIDWEYEDIGNGFCSYKGFGKNFKTPMPSLLGKHQLINAGVAISTVLFQDKIKVSEEAVCNGLKNTVWPGRIQKVENTILNKLLSGKYELYLDGAHNEAGARALGDWLTEEKKNKGGENVIIVSILKRKDSLSFIKNIKSAVAKVIVINNLGQSDTVDSHNAFKEGDVLKKEFEDSGFTNVMAVDSLELAFREANYKTDYLRRITICGSLYFVGHVLEIIAKNG
jgi:dihydrofolate synthase/folylpolyglutamate synthase